METNETKAGSCHSVEPLIPHQHINPFKHRINLNWYDYLKIGFMTITIFPIRCVLVLLILLVSCPLICIGLVTWEETELDQPIKGWRRHINTGLFFLWRAICFTSGFHWVRVIGQRASSLAAPIIVTAPHSTFFDIVILGVIPGCSVVATKIYTTNIFWVTAMLKLTQSIIVTPEDPNSRENTIKKIHSRVHSGGKFSQIIIYPEGRCTNRSALIPFKLGAFYPGVPVQPVVVRYPNRTNCVTWTWDGPSMAKVLWITMCQFHNYLEIEYLPVYKPSDAETVNAELFAQNVRDLMAHRLGIPGTEYTFDDFRLIMYAEEHHLTMSSGLIKFNQLNRKLGITYRKARDLLLELSKMSPQVIITIDQFGDYLHLPVSGPLSELFNLFDRLHSGTIDFREYRVGLSLISMPASTEDTLQLAIRLFDVEQDGRITLDELLRLLCHTFIMNQHQVVKLFQKLDFDTDGKITWDEFRASAIKYPKYAELFITKEKMRASKLGNNGPNVRPVTTAAAKPKAE